MRLPGYFVAILTDWLPEKFDFLVTAGKRLPIKVEQADNR